MALTDNDSDSLRKRYRIGIQLDSGKTMTGNVWQCTQLSIGAPRAVKILKPSLIKDAESSTHPIKKTFVDEFLSEIKYLAELAHPNIVGIIDGGKVQSFQDRKTLVPYYILELVRNARNLKKYAEDEKQVERLLRVLEQVLEGTVAMHSKSIVHMDMKPDNILISRENQEEPIAKITDLSFARRFDLRRKKAAEPVFVLVKGTRGYVSPDLHFMPAIKWSDPMMVGGFVGRSQLEPGLDLYTLGVTIQEIADSTLHANKGHAFLEQCYALRDFGRDLKNDIFRNSADALSYFRRKFRTQLPFQEARHFPSKMIRIPEFLNVPFSERIETVLNNPWFQRLRGVKQLGFVHLVYPGAVHTRFEHSLGVYNKATKYLLALWENSRQFRKEVADTDLEATMLAALMHDLGQYPFAHIIEETGILPSGAVKHETLSRQVIRGDESLWGSLSVSALKRINVKRFFATASAQRTTTLSQQLQEYWSPDTIALAEKLIHPTGAERRTFTPVQQVLADVLSGPIDCDKLDYLFRDGHHASCPFPRAIDEGRLLISLQMLQPDPNRKKRWVLGITHKGRATAELLVFVRYIMFTEVYWHHAVRIAIRMFQEVLSHVIEKRYSDLEARKDIYTRLLFMSDDDIFSWLREEASELAKENDNVAEEILDGLGKRVLYKRILTISPYGTTPSLHRDLVEIQNLGRRNQVEAFLAKQLRVKRHELLVDIPAARPGDEIKGIHMLDAENGEPVNVMERDSVLKKFQRDFLMNAKKIRVLVSPAQYEKSKQQVGNKSDITKALGEKVKDLL